MAVVVVAALVMSGKEWSRKIFPELTGWLMKLGSLSFSRLGGGRSGGWMSFSVWVS